MSKTRGVIVTLTRDHAGEYRWAAEDAGNHEPMGESSEGYTHRIDAVASALQVCGPIEAIRFPSPDGLGVGD